MNKEFILEKTVEQIQDEVWSKISYLNAGGCGWFTYLVGKELKRRNIKFQIRTFEAFWDDDNRTFYKKEAIRNYFNGRGSFPNSMAGSHHVLQVGNMFFDGEQSCTPRNEDDLLQYMDRDRLSEVSYTLQDMNLMLQEIRGWNDTYDTRQNKRLVGIIKRAFTQVFDEAIK